MVKHISIFVIAIIFIVIISLFFINYTKKNVSSLKIIDLTHTFTKSMPVHAYDEPASIKKMRNLDTHKYNDSQIISGMHVGTHIDGPGHLTNSSLLISDIAVDKFIGKGYLIDARNKKIDASLLKNMPIETGLVVLILTGFDKKFGTEKYYKDYPIVSVDFAEELVKREVKMLGIDTFAPDEYPFPVHKILLQNNILIIENLMNIERLLGLDNFNIIALPLKTETDSSLARVIAIVN